MPFKSKAQRRKFAELLVKGEISDEVYERWNRDTGRRELPERAKPKPAGRTRTTQRKAKPRVKRASRVAAKRTSKGNTPSGRGRRARSK